MSAARDLARWAIGLNASDVPSEVRKAVAAHLVDGIGCALAASRMREAEAIVSVATELGGSPESTIIGGSRVAAPNAALANGALVHALDFDDTHGDALVHVTASVLPAALAAAEAVGASGKELLTACTAGFEVVIRLGSAARHGFHARGFHATSVCGIFAAALSAARLYDLDEDATVNALGIAGSAAAGSLQFLDDGSSTKQLHPGLSGHGGLLAVLLAASGASGPERIFEGERGLYAAYADRMLEPGALTAGLGSEWHSTRITIKPYPVCQLSHASLDALLASGVEPDSVEKLIFRIPADAVAIVCEPLADKQRPRSAYEAKFSLPWCAATLMADRALGIDSFSPLNLARQDVADLALRVGYEAYDPGVAAADAGGEVRIRLRNGDEKQFRVTASSGSPDAPLDADSLLEKFQINAGLRGKDVGELVLELDSLPDVRAVTTLLGAHAEVVR